MAGLLTVATPALARPKETGATAGPSSAPGKPTFTHGVASGDVTATSAVLWTRADRRSTLKVEVFRNPSLSGQKAFQAIVRASAERDYTAKMDATGLDPGTRYYYRFRHGNRTSSVGTFETAPDPSRPADLRLTYSGDSDATGAQGGRGFYNAFEVLDRAREESSDFFAYLGDTIYSDSSLRIGGPALTLDQYRAAYREARTIPALPNLLAATSIYAQPDDHEVHNDYDGQTVDRARYAIGRQAFLEYMPIREGGFPRDPTCAGDPLYRKYKWGSNVEVFILDERSCRSADVSAVCNADLGPTAPTELRTQFPFNLFLPPTPPPGCLEAMNDPARTMLGPVQKELFLSDLRRSTATYKVVLSQLAIQQFIANPYDRWEGYAAERKEVLDFIRANSIENVVFLTTDNHANLVNEVFVDRFTDPETIAFELVTGPIATNTLDREIRARFGSIGVNAFNQVLHLVGLDCRNLNVYSYGVMNVSGATGAASVQLKDDTGANVLDQFSLANCGKAFP